MFREISVLLYWTGTCGFRAMRPGTWIGVTCLYPLDLFCTVYTRSILRGRHLLWKRGRHMLALRRRHPLDPSIVPRRRHNSQTWSRSVYFHYPVGNVSHRGGDDGQQGRRGSPPSLSASHAFAQFLSPILLETAWVPSFSSLTLLVGQPLGRWATRQWKLKSTTVHIKYICSRLSHGIGTLPDQDFHSGLRMANNIRSSRLDYGSNDD